MHVYYINCVRMCGSFVIGIIKQKTKREHFFTLGIFLLNLSSLCDIL